MQMRLIGDYVTCIISLNKNGRWVGLKSVSGTRGALKIQRLANNTNKHHLLVFIHHTQVKRTFDNDAITGFANN